MFATLGGTYPAPVPVDDDIESVVRAAVVEQVEAGLEPVSDGGLRHPDRIHWFASALDGFEPGAGGASRPRVTALPTWREPIAVADWSSTASCSDRATRQAIVGPYTLARAVDAGAFDRRDVTLALAEALNAELRGLAEVGCPLVQVDEDDATTIGEAPAERALFVEAQRRLLDGLDGFHASLAIRGGNADGAGAATILGAPYRSYLFDLCAGPENWRLIAAVPGDVGVIVGAEDARTIRPETLEILAFAIGYAASIGGRGHDRVGVATSGDMHGIDHVAALAKIHRIGEVAALYAGEPGALARAMDPRAVDIRSAALGRQARGPAPGKPPRGTAPGPAALPEPDGDTR